MWFSKPVRIALLGVAGWAALASAQQPAPVFSEAGLPVYSRIAVVNAIGRNFKSSTALKWRWTYAHPTSTEWLQCFIGVREAPATPNWRLAVFDSDEGGNEIERLVPADFERRVPRPQRGSQQMILPRAAVEGPVDEAWTGFIPGSRTRIELYADGDVGDMSVQIERCNFEFSQSVPKAIVGDDDRQDLVRAFGREHRYYQWSLPVAFILFQKLQGDDTNCTGFLITPTMLMTNHHCISSARQLRTSVVEFGFESQPVRPPVRIRLKELLYSHDGLDMTLLRLQTTPGIQPARLDETAAASNVRLILLQHPERQPKTIAVKNCAVEAQNVVGAQPGVNTDFFHSCDSAGGSSGSPLMSETTGAVVGLHHLAMYDSKLGDYRNLGVNVRQILQTLQASRRDLYDEIVAAQRGLPREPR